MRLAPHRIIFILITSALSLLPTFVFAQFDPPEDWDQPYFTRHSFRYNGEFADATSEGRAGAPYYGGCLWIGGILRGDTLATHTFDGWSPFTRPFNPGTYGELLDEDKLPELKSVADPGE